MNVKFIRNFLAIFVALPLMAEEFAPIMAKESCQFTSECFENESCSETDYAFSLEYLIGGMIAEDEGVGRGQASDISGDYDMMVLYESGAIVANKVQFESASTILDDAVILMRSAGGEARLLVSQPKTPMVITYFGSCERQAR